MNWEKTSYNLLLLGGTGARCGEIFIHMCANGYFNGEKVNILYIDSDSDNGNTKSMRNLYDTYCKCRKHYRIEGSPVPLFFKPEIELRYINPVMDLDFFSDLASKGQTEDSGFRSTIALMRALYSDKEVDMKISDGFFARPNVGSAVLAANMDQIMADFLCRLENERKGLKKIKVFMIGSIFGGTGASSFPTISRYLKTKLYGESTDKLIGDKLKIGGCMLLPYFAFSRENMDEEKLKRSMEVDAEKFSTKTKAAIKYYKEVDKQSDQNDQKIFDALYIIGHDGHDVRGKYETAGSGQRNLPHISEFYAAMSAVTFFEENNLNEGKYFGVAPEEKIDCHCMYKSSQCYFSFLIMMRFSLTMKSLILEELFKITDGQKRVRDTINEIPWYYDFIAGREQPEDLDTGRLDEKLSAISDYCNKYISWFAELIIKNITKIENPEQIGFSHHKKRINDWEEDDDLYDYLNLFSKELIIKQYVNIRIENDGISGFSTRDLDSLWQQNIQYIRKHVRELSNQAGMDKNVSVTFERIWSRLSQAGFNTLKKDENVIKNIASVQPRTMEEGVRNLINAVYLACMI